MEENPIKRVRGSPKKTLGETIKKDHTLDGFTEKSVFDRD